MKKIVIPVVLTLLLMFCVSPAYAGIPTLPHAFYGDVEINGSPAPDGTQVSAMVDTGDIIPAQNPVSTVGGNYGVDSPYLLVQGSISSGAVITFCVNGIESDELAIFEVGGGPTEVDLSIVISKPSSDDGNGGGGDAGYTVETDIFGDSGSFVTDYKGKVLDDFGVTSEDGMLSLQIDEGTVALGEDGKRLTTLEAVVADDPPAPPEGKNIVGLPYDFSPDGATFNPPITLTWQYDPDVDPEDLVIAYYDGSQWVELPCTVDYENGVIIAEVAHFSVFAMLSVAEIPVTPVAPAPVIAPPIPAPVIPTPSPEPAPAPSPVEPSPQPQPAPAPPAPTVPVEDKGLSGGAIAGIIIGITILVVGVVFFIARSRRQIYRDYSN